MKRIFLITSFLFLNLFEATLFGQITDADLLPKEDGNVRLTKIVDVPNKTRSDLRQSFETFVTSNGEKWGATFTSPNSVSKSKSIPLFSQKNEISNDSMLVYKCQIALPKSSALLSVPGQFESHDRELVTFTLAGYFKNGKYKVETSNFIHTNLMDPTTSSGGRFENEKADWKVLKGKSAWNEIKKRALTQADKLMKAIEGSIGKSNNGDFNF